MRYAGWTAAVLPAALLSITAATAGEPDVPRRLGPQVVEAPGTPVRLERNRLLGPRVVNEAPRRSKQLGPIAKLRRARYVMSRLKELKPGRGYSTQ